MYLERRRRRWYALHDIPADAQEALGGRRRFVQSLETEDKNEAKRRAAPLEARWRSEIEKARRQSTDHVERDALFWRKVMLDTPEEQRGMIRDLIASEAERMVENYATREGFSDHREKGFDELPIHADAGRFYAIATGERAKLEEHLEEYLATLRNEEKSVDMKRSSIKKFSAEFHYIQDVKRKSVQEWVNKLAKQGKAVATIRRSLSELRGYWSYLISIEAASENNLPFEKLALPKVGKREAREDERKPFKAADVIKLLHRAEEKGDTALADLIRLAMWTGARIEELCALKVQDVANGFLDIRDAKTAAGVRQVPIHTELQGTVERLAETSKDGFVLAGLTMNKYGDRSNAIGKRFGRLKVEMGFGEEHVFHSIRKTVATLLDNAGVPENVAADILGHDKPTITYGLYSGGASLDVKRRALHLIHYR